MILFDDVSDDYNFDDGRNSMTFMWKTEKLTRSVQKALRLIIVPAVKWTSLTVIFIGKDKTKWGKEKVLHTFDAMAKCFDKITRDY